MADDTAKNPDDRSEESPREEVSEEREPRVQDPSTGSGQADDKSSRRVDPETGDIREQPDAAPTEGSADAGLSEADTAILDDAKQKLVADYEDMARRAQAELVNFRTRVERDRAANRDAVIAEVIRSLLPAIDDLDRAEAHGDLAEGTPLAIVAQKLRAGFAKYGLTRVGETGEPFDPNRHEALVRIPTPEATGETVGDVIEIGYALGDRLIRAAKVAVHVPE